MDEASLRLPRAVWDLGSRILVTTNYDRVLEWACPDEERPNLNAWDVESVAADAGRLFLKRPGSTTIGCMESSGILSRTELSEPLDKEEHETG